MLEEVTLWSKKIKDGMQIGYDFHFENSAKLPKNIKKIVFVGMGGSGISGRIIQTFLDRKSNIPSFVIDSPEIPAYIDQETLAIVVSYSGNTWETVECAEILAEKFIPTVVLTRGGRIAEIAEAKNIPVILLPESSTPRSSLGNVLGIILTLLDLMEVMDGKEILQSFIKQADLYTPKFKDDEAYFKEFVGLAKNHDMFHVWGISGDSAACAYRAQTQFNENSKIQAVTSYLPELNHNLLCGFEKFEQKPLVVLFSTEFLSPSLEISLESTCELLKEIGVSLYKVPVLGDNWEGQLFHMILWADFASCYVGNSRGVELKPVRLIERLKLLHGKKMTV